MNNARIHLNATRFLPGLIFGTAAGVLAYEPVRWLVQTWQDPAYDSKGFLIFVVCAGLFLWSATSPRNPTCRLVETSLNLMVPMFGLTLLPLAGMFNRMVNEIHDLLWGMVRENPAEKSPSI
jgi:hypothetical protein